MKARRSSKHAATDRLLILSRRHLTDETLGLIEATFDFGVRIFRSGSRHIIQLRDAESDPGNWPADLRQVTDYATAQGCGWVLVDEFAEPNPDLPCY